MVNNRRRGRVAENEFAERYFGRRVSRTGEAGPDVIDVYRDYVEVKRVKQLPASLKSWLTQAHTEGAAVVAFRENRGPWYVILAADEYYEAPVTDQEMETE